MAMLAVVAPVPVAVRAAERPENTPATKSTARRFTAIQRGLSTVIWFSNCLRVGRGRRRASGGSVGRTAFVNRLFMGVPGTEVSLEYQALKY